MICKTCKLAAARAQAGAGHGIAWARMVGAHKLHQACRGASWCDCQHRGPNGEPPITPREKP